MKTTGNGWCHSWCDKSNRQLKTWFALEQSTAQHMQCFTRRISTCLCGCCRLSFPVMFLLSLSLNPRSQQPLGNNTPTLPASSNPILTRLPQLAARTGSKAADWCHKTEGEEGEGTMRKERRRRRRVFLLSCFYGWQTMIMRIRQKVPVSQLGKAWTPHKSVCPTTLSTMLNRGGGYSSAIVCVTWKM